MLSGTTDFNLDLNACIEEAWEKASGGGEIRAGYEFRTARRSLNMLVMQWANRGYNLWTLEQGSIPMVQGQIVYDLPIDTVDLAEQVIRTQTGQNQTDINITRISLDTYSTIPNKNAQGRPIQVWINRRSGATTAADEVQYPQINVWPCADQDNFYTFIYWRLRRMQDVGNGTTTQDVPFRMIPALVAGLAYEIAQKIPDGQMRLQQLKADYDEQWMLASDEDREKAPLRLAPRQMFW